MKNLLSAVLGLGMTLSVGCSKQNEFQPPPPPSVTVQQPQMNDVIVYNEFPGRTVPSDSADIRARVRGYLKSIEFEDGQRVEEGDLLFTIEPEEYQAAVQAAEAQLKQAEAAVELADARLTRINEAWETKAVAEVDKLTAEAEQQAAQAGVAAAQAVLENARLSLSYTELRAPFDGRTGERALSVGNLVGNGESTLLTTLVAESPIYVYFTVDERSLLQIKDPGFKNRSLEDLPPVKLRLADGSIHDEEGRIVYRDSEIDPDTGTLQARAVFPNEDIKLIAGLYGKIMIPENYEDALLIPDVAIQRDLSGSFVLIVNAEGKVESRYIEFGAQVDTMRIIEDGLTAEDTVIVKGLQRARPGIAVTAEQRDDAE